MLLQKMVRFFVIILFVALDFSAVFAQQLNREDSLRRREEMEQYMRLMKANPDSMRQIRQEMVRAQAQKRLEASKSIARNTSSLRLSDLGLKKLPKHVEEFTNLKRLELQGN